MKPRSIMLKVLLSLFGLVINLVCVYSSSIYTSINWDPQNPFFTTKSQSCSSGYMTLKVQLQSKVYFICPNTATVLQETLTAAQTATMYENLWIVYNRTVFNKCDTSLEKGNKTSRQLFQCNTPTLLKYFPVLFAEFTADPNGLRFEGGKKYYFIGTSDGTQTHINDPKGGHCNDTGNGIFMKIEVYVCKKSNLNYKDEQCHEDVGILKCHDNPTPTTTVPTTILPTTTSSMSSTIPPTKTTQAPSTQEQTTATVDRNTSGQIKVTGSNQTPTEPVKKSSLVPQNAEQVGDNRMQKELERWKVLAITLMVLCILLIIVVCIIYYMYRRKENRPDTKVRHQSNEKNPASRQESVGGVSNRCFTSSLVFNTDGDNFKTAPSPTGFPVFYEVPNENSSIGSTEVDGKKPSQDGSIVIENKEVHFAKDRKIENGRKPTQDGSTVFENKEVHFANDGRNNARLVSPV